MNILLLGSGGREHALAWAISASPQLDQLYCAPGNAGTASIAINIALDHSNHQEIIDFCTKHKIELVVIGPEGPLVTGVVDSLQAANINAFGPTKAAAQLEGSKAFTKSVCDARDIPTSAYGHFDNQTEALAYITEKGAPIVIKADGLAAGKGVTVAMTVAEAQEAIADIFSGKFGAAEVVIEEFLEGEEASFFAICDGVNAQALATAQDHKRVGDGDRGPNTGGMGAYSPAPVMNDALCQQVMDEIIMPTMAEMTARNAPFRGILYAGLMITKDGPKLIEYNTRFGDPECQVLMMRLQYDLVELIDKAVHGKLKHVKLAWRDDAALCVVMAAQGYPGAVEKGSEIHGLEQAEAARDVMAFHAGTKKQDGVVVANGGRVLNITALGATVSAARNHAYTAVEQINWPQGFYRSDIGWRAIARENEND